MQDTDGNFYGTTDSGGPNGGGTVFRLSVGLGSFVKTQTTVGEAGAAIKTLGTALTGTTRVTFNGSAATFTVISASEIITSVPTGATTGLVAVVTPSGTLSSNVVFNVLHSSANIEPDSYNPLTGNLTIPLLNIGAATFTDMEVLGASVVGGPFGTLPNGTADTYNPASGQLSVQVVTAGSGTYYDEVFTFTDLDSIGGVTGADTYDGTYLSIPHVEVLGGPAYSNVVITVAGVDKVGGGMPALTQDEYIPATGQLNIPAVEAYGKVYTNVVITVGTLVSVGP
jgi:uncharacterized repeat protein (TIGR03803 family)